jgi:hypothetical protein
VLKNSWLDSQGRIVWSGKHRVQVPTIHKRLNCKSVGIWLNLCANREKALSGLINRVENSTAGTQIIAREPGGYALVVKRNPPIHTNPLRFIVVGGFYLPKKCAIK